MQVRVLTLTLVALLMGCSPVTGQGEAAPLLIDVMALTPESTGNGSIWIQVAGDLVIGPGSVLMAANGIPGTAQSSTGVARGGDGGPGGSIHLEASRIVFAGATLKAGDGGAGGAAIAIGRDASAFGGNGGAAGQVELIGEIVGQFTVIPAMGGAGGNATATAEPGTTCQGRQGESDFDAPTNATIGDGPDANATARAGECGAPGQTGGIGGSAEAHGGDGGPGGSAGNGGRGGDAFANAGEGGPGGSICGDNYSMSRAGNGGPGGNLTAIGGDGGPGLTGGAGGNAHGTSKGGRGGDAPRSKTPGQGGIIFANASSVQGGAGGVGVNGGSGGSAAAATQGGDGGNLCPGSGPAKETSLGSLAFTGLLIAVFLRRR